MAERRQALVFSACDYDVPATLDLSIAVQSFGRHP